jgi:class 3 adenylate cyclase
VPTGPVRRLPKDSLHAPGLVSGRRVVLQRTSVLTFSVLGPLEVREGDRVIALPRRKHRVLLAVLLLRADEVVSTDALIEQLWGEKPPRTAKDALVNYVSLLRKALGPDVLLTRDPGYVLDVRPEQTDLGRFERLAAGARATRSAGERAETLRQALALWRGAPFADLAFEPFAELEIDRIEDLRLAAREDLIDAELDSGHHADLLPELETLIQEHPFDERLRAQLILALFRAGRQADALEAYQATRRLLVEELGLEPGPPLRELEQAVLRQDPALAIPTPAIAAAPPSRRTVTVLFADLVESSELAERLDPEALRAVLDRYFTAMRTAIERHGGTVEKFIGDAVMAVFGAPRAHEDDALRAVRAAVDIREAVAELEGVQARVGVNTGEVFTGGDANVLVTGATVNLAKRLEQAAPAGEILVGAATLRLVRDAVEAEPVEPLHRGDAEPVLAFRVPEVKKGATGLARRFDVPLVGRKQELAQLQQAFQGARAQRRCQVVTALGEAGIGKTRLAQELIASVGDEATVLVGRCVSYGEGATYLPLADMISGVGDLIAGADSTGEIALETRKRFEQLAAARPLVLVFEDVHWAEPTLLDLIEYLDQRAEGSILCLCLARPEHRHASRMGTRPLPNCPPRRPSASAS